MCPDWIDADAVPPSRARRRWLLGALASLAAPAGFAQAPEPAPMAELRVPYMPYAAFDRLPVERVEVTGGVIRVAFAPGRFTAPRYPILDFVRESARSVATYYGRFPARDTRLLILPSDEPGARPVRSGTAFGERGAAIKLVLGETVTREQLDRDWILVHEMTHLALPSVPRRQHWIEEGSATYVEPLARAQAGRLSVERVWSDLLRGLPQGLPQAGDRGLDNTPTWGRTYWGGALFCLLADVGIRERSANRQGLQHALRAIMRSGNMETESALEPLLRIGDAAVGVPVLTELHAAMKDEPHPVDLDALWRRLGVRLVDGDAVVFDPAAPLAAIREALTTPIAATT